MAPKTTRALAAYLRELILEHHTAFKDLYPERPITPKMHYIIHIPQWMTRLIDLYVILMDSMCTSIIYSVPFTINVGNLLCKCNLHTDVVHSVICGV